MSRDTVYPSKVDWWLGVLLVAMAAAALVSFVLGARLLVVGQTEEGWWLTGTGALAMALLGFLVWPVRYTLTRDQLIIRFGVFRSRLELSSITGARPSHNPLSSPALSLDRLKISHTGSVGFTLISPADREGFMRDLATRCNGLVYRDGRVVADSDARPG